MNAIQIKIARAVARFTRTPWHVGMNGILSSWGRNGAYGSSSDKVMYSGGLCRNELESMVKDGLIIRYNHPGIEADALLLSEEAWSEVLESVFMELLMSNGELANTGSDKLLMDYYDAEHSKGKVNEFRYWDGGNTHLQAAGLVMFKTLNVMGEHKLSPAGTALASRLIGALA